MDKTGVADEFKVESSDSPFIKGVHFNDGLTLTVVGMEKFTPELGEDGTDYGVKNEYGAGGVLKKENWFVKKGLLKEGESFKYRFTQNGVEKTFDNKSFAFYDAFNTTNPEATDEVFIKRVAQVVDGKASTTKFDWTIQIVE